jgi:predicted MFS family arabinose efflux permease
VSTQPPGTAPPAPRGAAGAQRRIPRRLVAVLAVACGVVVANNYWAQPLLPTLARDLSVSEGTAGIVVTTTQLGYALGLAFIVPLGDLLERRRLVAVVLAVTAAALIGSALAPNLPVLAAFGLLVGATSVVAMILVPFAANLAGDEERGAVVGTVMSGLLIGVLLSRTVSGLVAQAAGWRAVFAVAAVLMVGLAALLRAELPPAAPSTDLRYPQLLRSVLALIRHEPLLRHRMAYGAAVFATFSVLWTALSLVLATSPYHYGAAVTGLFGLLGAGGALAASFAGRLADRGLQRWLTVGFVLAILAAWALLAQARAGLLPLILGILLLDLGVQGTHITNQSLVYSLAPEARSRLTTGYMVAYFLGGAIGSLAASVAWAAGGWSAVVVVGAVPAALALLLWLVEGVVPVPRAGPAEDVERSSGAGAV